MKKLLLLLTIITIFVSVSNALPVISDLSIDPSSLWLGESTTISLTCMDDNENNTIEKVYLNVSGPDVFISDWNMDSLENNVYSLTIDNSYLYKIGEYLVSVYCENNVSEIITNTTSFKVSQLTSEITQITPDSIYPGDEIEVYVFVMKDGTRLSSGVNFTVTIGDYEKIFNEGPPPLYDGGKGWILKMNTPESIGTYDLVVKSQYNKVQTTAQKQIEIKQPLQFDLVNIDKTWLKQNDNIELTFQGLQRGETIDLTKNNLQICMDGNNCEILETSRVGSYSYIKIKTPNLPPGKYDLKIRLTYEDFIKEITEKVEYIFTISGDIINAENKAVSTTIEFKNSEITTSINTDKNGHYTTEIPIGIYEVQLKFPKSKVVLSEVDISEFNDPIRYDEAGPSIDLEGVGIADIFVYEFALNFDDAYIEMRYDDSRILDEDMIIVYRCNNWNFGKRICNEDWEGVNTDIDTIRNYVKLNTTSLSTFLIGYKKEMIVDGNVEKEQYYLNDIIKVLGVVEDEEQKPIVDAKVDGRISGTNIEFTTQTDEGGEFTVEFQGPDREGKYDLLIEAEKSPFDKVDQKTVFEVVKSRKLTLTAPYSLKIKQSENSSTEFVLNNLGQTDFHDLKISIEGVPNYYTLFETEFNEIKAGKEKRISVVFEIPEDANVQSHTGKVKVEYDDGILEDEFILTILEMPKETEDEKKSGLPTFNLPSAHIVLPNLSSGAFLISIFGILSIGGTIWFKNKKMKPDEEREDIKNLLMDIKREIERDQKEVKKSKSKQKKGKTKKKPKNRVPYAS